MSEACARCEKWQQDWDRLRSERDMIQEFWTDLGNEVLANAPENYDGDEAADAIAVRYVRDLEATIARVRTLAGEHVEHADGCGLLAGQILASLDGAA